MNHSRMSEPTEAAPLRCPSCGASAGEDAATCSYCGANLTVVGCPNCFAHLFAGMRYCPKCGTEAARVEEGATELLCPDCRHTLTKVRVGVITLGECAGCRGLWLDAELFARLIDHEESRASVLRWHAEAGATLVTPVSGAVRYRACPRCRKLMNRVNFARVSKVIVDVCKDDGTWFDRDELARVVTFVQDGGLTRTREVEASRLAEEKRRLIEQQHLAAERRGDSWRADQLGRDRAAGRNFKGPIERFLDDFLS